MATALILHSATWIRAWTQLMTSAYSQPAFQPHAQDEKLQRAVANSTAGYAELTAMVRNTTLGGGQHSRGSFDQAAMPSPGCGPSRCALVAAAFCRRRLRRCHICRPGPLC